MGPGRGGGTDDRRLAVGIADVIAVCDGESIQDMVGPMRMRRLDKKNVAALRALVRQASLGNFPQMERMFTEAGYRRGFFARTGTETASFFGIAIQTFRGWLGRGAPGRTKDGYDMQAIARWRNQHLLAQIRQPAAVDADEELKRIKTEREKIKLARERDAVIEIDAVERVWRRYFAACKSIILGIPDRMLVVLPDDLRPELRGMLGDTADEVLSQLGRAADDLRDGDDEGVDDDQDDDDDDGGAPARRRRCG